MIERVAGDRPHTCPWEAYSNPWVIEVLQSYRMASNGDGMTPALLVPLDLPHDVWQGVNYFHEATLRIRANDRRVAAERRKGSPTR